MKINSLFFTDKSSDWELKPVSFDKLTLLVGASGVGKTRILNCILDLKRVTRGKSLNGVKWSIEFSTSTNNYYKWEGEFENKGYMAEHMFFSRRMNDDDTDKDKSKIISEKLFFNDELLVDRDPDNINFDGAKTVKLSQSESAISLLKEEDKIKDIYSEFEKIIFDDNSSSSNLLRYFSIGEDIQSKADKFKSLIDIRESNEQIRSKLFFTYKNQRNEFDDISNAFMDVFPHVEGVKIEPIDSADKQISSLLKDIPLIQIKEKGVKNWIDEEKMSSGMIRSLIHIAELYLCADSSLILIDEFENSLGVNCIDELTSSILSADRDLQFVITSHHPYIINNIDYSHWKLISRNAGAVVAHNASEFDFGKSKHEAFTQLINLDLYIDGADA